MSVPGDEQQRRNRVSALGSLSGIVTGVGIGAVFGLLRRAGLRPPTPVGAVMIGLTAMASTNISMVSLNVTDLRTWSAADWLSDAIPHLIYGAVTYATLEALDRR